MFVNTTYEIALNATKGFIESNPSVVPTPTMPPSLAAWHRAPRLSRVPVESWLKPGLRRDLSADLAVRVLGGMHVHVGAAGLDRLEHRGLELHGAVDAGLACRAGAQRHGDVPGLAGLGQVDVRCERRPGELGPRQLPDELAAGQRAGERPGALGALERLRRDLGLRRELGRDLRAPGRGGAGDAPERAARASHPAPSA